MADGAFATLVSKDRSANATGNPIYIQITDGTSALGVTGGALDVNIDNASIVVTATDLDIRNLSQTQDHVLIYGNTVKDGSGTDYVPLLDADGKVIISNPGGTEYIEDAVAPQPATGTTMVVERDDALSAITPAEGDWSKLYCSANGALWVDIDGTVAVTQSGTWNIATVTTLTGITNDVNIADGGNSITVDDGGGSLTVDGSVTVTATDLDIRDLTHVSDSVTIGDGTETLNITAAGEAEIDIAAQSLTAVKISATAAANTETNPIYVHNVDTVISGEEVHDYDTAAGVAADATSNHDYTVTGTTMLLKSVIVSGSGNVKFEIQAGPLASLVTYAVGFLTGRQGDTQQVKFDPAIEVPVTSTGTVRVIRTNRQGASTDVYSTIIGNDV